jgi:signal transduction histidine kinase/ActR/RegA family two-component response regulator
MMSLGVGVSAERDIDFLAGGGEMGRIMRQHDWSSSPLGRPAGWPQALRTAVRLLLNTGHPMYIWWGPDLICLYNDAYSRSIGPDRHPASLGRPGREVWAEIWPIIGPMVDQVMAGGEATWRENDLVPITRFGRREDVYWTYSYSPIDDEEASGGIGGVLVVCAETTQAVQAQHKAEARSRATESRYQALFQTIEAGFCIIEVGFEEERARDYMFVEVNPAFERQTGLVGAEGRSARELVPDLEQHWFDLYGRVAMTGEPDRFESGSEAMGRFFDVYAFRIDEPERRRVALLFNDISERRLAELALERSQAELRDLAATLEQRVRERSEELRVAEEALRQSQKMEAVGQLTGGLAHDFNNLLTGMMGNLELLQTRIARGRLDDVDRFVNAAQGAGRRAASLTQRLLAFSRRQTLDPKPTNVNKLIAGMEELLRRTVGGTTEIEIVGAAGLWTANIDAGQLENALLNLCINARDAMPDGGRITVETANKWLDERTGRERDLPPGQYLSICVTDTGVGMSAETIERAFEPFYTTKPIGQGTGLGLSMIYGFARQSGGQVRIYSELGVGTTVCVYLPRHIGEVDASDVEEAVRDVESAAGQTVLIVEDEATIRHLVDEVLDEAGYTVIGAADGASGIKVLQSGARVELLITDVGLPNGMNGRQVADAARSLRPGLKVLFITGYAENAAVGNGHLEPGMELLTKPFSMEALVAKVGAMLNDATVG